MSRDLWMRCVRRETKQKLTRIMNYWIYVSNLGECRVAKNFWIQLKFNAADSSNNIIFFFQLHEYYSNIMDLRFDLLKIPFFQNEQYEFVHQFLASGFFDFFFWMCTILQSYQSMTWIVNTHPQNIFSQSMLEKYWNCKFHIEC